MNKTNTDNQYHKNSWFGDIPRSVHQQLTVESRSNLNSILLKLLFKSNLNSYLNSYLIELITI